MSHSYAPKIHLLYLLNKLRPLIPNPSNLLGIREEHISCSSSFWVQWYNKLESGRMKKPHTVFIKHTQDCITKVLKKKEYNCEGKDKQTKSITKRERTVTLLLLFF